MDADERTETCVLCGNTDRRQNLGLWLVNDESRPVHTECWVVAYLAKRFDIGEMPKSA
jgi:hypothetical protein